MHRWSEDRCRCDFSLIELCAASELKTCTGKPSTLEPANDCIPCKCTRMTSISPTVVLKVPDPAIPGSLFPSTGPYFRCPPLSTRVEHTVSSRNRPRNDGTDCSLQADGRLSSNARGDSFLPSRRLSHVPWAGFVKCGRRSRCLITDCPWDLALCRGRKASPGRIIRYLGLSVDPS